MEITIPNNEEVENRIAALIAETELAAFATVSVDGLPHNSCLHLAGIGTTMYFSSWQYARKYTHIQNNSNVSIELHTDLPGGFDDRDKMKSLQITGKASYVTDLEEMEAVIQANYAQHSFLKEFDVLSSFKRVLTGAIPLEKIRQRIIRVDPVEALYTDNSVFFMWRNMISFDQDGHVSEMKPYPGDLPSGVPAMEE